MNKSTPRVHRFLKRQREQGKKPHLVWLRPEILRQLKRFNGKTIGERIERLILALK